MTRQSASNRQRYRFGEFLLDAASRELRRGDDHLTLSPKVFDCIAYLLENRDRAVGRDELIAAIWGKADIAYTLLCQLVAKARRAVGGAGNDQNVICTISRFGYRWVAPTQVGDAMAMDPRAAVHSFPVRDPNHPSSMWRSLMRAHWTSLLLAIAILGGWLYIGMRTTATTRELLPSNTSNAAAVLPVEITADPDWSWVRLGVMDLIADRLRSAGQTVVRSENIVALARNNTADRGAHAVLEVTGARYVVAPTAVRTEKEWMVRLVLSSAADGERAVEARDGDITVAGRQAADQLVTLLGLADLPARRKSSDPPGDELLARARSALLSNDLDVARRVLESAPPDHMRSPALRRRLAQLDYRSDNLKSAGTRLEELLGEVSVEANPALRAGVLNDFGAVAILRDQPVLAQKRFDEALALLANSDDPDELGRAHTGRGVAYAMQGDYARVAPEFAQARIAFTLAGDAMALAGSEINEGTLEIRYNHYAAAKPIFERASERYEQLGMRDELFMAQAGEMEVNLELLDPQAALAIGVRDLPRLKDLQDPISRRYFQFQWARTLVAVGRLTEARVLLGELASDAGTTAHVPFFGQVRAQQAALDLVDGNKEDALAEAAEAVSALSLPDYARDRAKAWMVAIHALRARGREIEAATEVRRFEDWAAMHPKMALYSRIAEAEQDWTEMRREGAGRLYEEALQEATQSGVPADISAVVGSYGSALLADGDLGRASAVIGSTTRFADRDFGCSLLEARLYHALEQPDAWQSSLNRARALAGERVIPSGMSAPPNNTAPPGMTR